MEKKEDMFRSCSTSIEDGKVRTDSERRSNELYELLGDWVMSTVQALVDSAGSEGALELLRPYFRNAGVAGLANINKFLNLDLTIEYNWEIAAMACLNILSRSQGAKVEIRENGTIASIDDCPFKNAPVELCRSFCEVGPNAMAEMYQPDIHKTLVSILSEGDPKCVWVMKRIGSEMPKSPEDLGMVKSVPLIPTVPEDMMDIYSLQYLAEVWVIAVKALIDHLGPEMALEVIRPYMRHRGISYGLRTKEKGRGPATIGRIYEIVVDCSRTMKMEGKEAIGPDGTLSMTITSCPFSDAPPTVCSLIESFYNGIGEGLGQQIKLCYDGKMTEGAERCRWKLGAKDETKNTEAPKASSSPEDPIKVLKLRLAKGEISREDYEMLRRLISE